MFDEIGSNAELQVLELVSKQTSVDQVYGWCPVASRLASGLDREATSADYDALVRPADHCPTKIPDDVRTDVALITLALKQHVEANQTANADSTVAVDASVTTSLSDLDLDEA